MRFSILLTLAVLSSVSFAQANDKQKQEQQIQACIKDCLANSEIPGWELRACISQCQKWTAYSSVEIIKE